MTEPLTISADRRQNAVRVLLILALPMIGVTLSRMLMGFIDFAMVSQLGTAAQAAISPSTLLLFVIACLGMGMAQSVQTFVSQAEGRGEPQRGGAYVWQALYIAAAAAILSAPVAATVERWFPLLGRFGHHPADVQEREIQFLRYGLWAIGPMIASASLECFYNGIRRPIIDLIAVIVSLLTLTLGNYIFIFGNLGAPALGIGGSGLATLLAWCVRVLVLLIPFLSESIHRRYRTRDSWRFRAPQFREIAGVGGPVALQWFVDIGAWFVFLEVLMPPFGAAAMAAGNIVIQFMHLSFMPSLGIGMALTTQVGNEIGAGRPDDAIFRVRVARRLVLGYMGLMALLFILAGGPMASLICFESDDALRAAVIRAAAAMAVWAALFQVFDGLCIVYSFASRGAGDTRVPALLFFVCCWAIFVLGGYFTVRFAPQWNFHGPWSMAAAYIVVLGILLARRFHGEAWRGIRLFKEDASRSQSPGRAGVETDVAAVDPATQTPTATRAIEMPR